MANEPDPLRDVAASATKSLGKAVGSFQKWAKNSERSLQSWTSTVGGGSDQAIEYVPPPPQQQPSQPQSGGPPAPVERRLDLPPDPTEPAVSLREQLGLRRRAEIERAFAETMEAAAETGTEPIVDEPGQSAPEPLLSEPSVLSGESQPSEGHSGVGDARPTPPPKPADLEPIGANTDPVSTRDFVVSEAGFVLPPPPASLDLPPAPVWD